MDMTVYQQLLVLSSLSEKGATYDFAVIFGTNHFSLLRKTNGVKSSFQEPSSMQLYISIKVAFAMEYLARWVASSVCPESN